MPNVRGPSGPAAGRPRGGGGRGRQPVHLNKATSSSSTARRQDHLDLHTPDVQTPTPTMRRTRSMGEDLWLREQFG